MEIIRGLIERIEVAPGEARGKATVTLEGALASILDSRWAPHMQKPPRTVAHVGSYWLRGLTTDVACLG